MSTQLATMHELFTEEQQEQWPYPDPTQTAIVQFTEKLPVDQVYSYLINPKPESCISEQETIPETTFVKERVEPPVIKLRKTPFAQDKFVSLQKWEGIVLAINENSFLARLIDLTEEGPDEEAEFPLEEISEEDRQLVKPGAIFYWNIGYHDTSRGQRIRSSMIRFRRIPVWQKAEIDDTKRKAKRLRDAIGWK